MKLLSEEEIADLTPALGDCILPPVGRGEYVSLDRATYERLRSVLPRLLDEVERSRALLKRIEWMGIGTYDTPCCPECSGFDPAHALGTDDKGHAPSLRARRAAWRSSLMRYFTDGGGRHLVCHPFSRENLHAMAEALGIKRCWFHNGGGGRFPHYDVPVGGIGKLGPTVELITTREVLTIIQGGEPPCQR